MSELERNQVFVALPRAVQELAAQRLVRETMEAWQLLRDESDPIQSVYFPVDGIISIVSLTAEGIIAESYAAGRDGIAGAELMLGAKRTIYRTMCQVPGACYKMTAEDFLDLIGSEPEFERVCSLYVYCMIALTGRSGACNLLHSVFERCARWLLVTQDRVAKDTFELTQEILSTMLGVRRPAVTIAAGALQKAGLIRYTRGQITILDRERLEEASCECYRIVAEEFRRVLGGP